MIFKAIEHENLARCANLFVAVFNHAPWNETWEIAAVVQRLEDCFNTPQFYGLVAIENDQLVGFALGHTESWDNSRYFNLREICVACSRQRQGVGTELMKALSENLKKQSVDKIYLHTTRDTDAQAFYEKHGFRVSEKMVMMLKTLE